MAEQNILILGWCNQCKNVMKMNEVTGEIIYTPQREAGRIKDVFRCDICRRKNYCQHRGRCILYDIKFNDVCTDKHSYCEPTTDVDGTDGFPNDAA